MQIEGGDEALGGPGDNTLEHTAAFFPPPLHVMMAVAALSLDCQEGQRLAQHRGPGLRRRLPLPTPSCYEIAAAGSEDLNLLAQYLGQLVRISLQTAGGIWGRAIPIPHLVEF